MQQGCVPVETGRRYQAPDHVERKFQRSIEQDQLQTLEIGVRIQPIARFAPTGRDQQSNLVVMPQQAGADFGQDRARGSMMRAASGVVGGSMQAPFRGIAAIAWLGAVVPSVSAVAHHSYTEFDNTQSIEIDGVLLNVAWQNPHALIEVQTAGPGGTLVTWEIETSGVNYLRRLQMPLEVFKVGNRVKVAGWPSKRSTVRMYGTNLLSDDGQEFVLWRSKPRWAGTAYGYVADRSGMGDTGVVGAATIFRVWSSVFGSSVRPEDPDASPQSLARVQMQLTPAAQAAVAQFNPVEESTAPGCKPKGMPDIMNQPFPIEFVDREDTILLRIEEYDTVRTIHMRDGANAEAQPETPLGYSTGRWEGPTLVVDTSRIDGSQYINNRGVPLGSGARLVERFTPNADGSRLHYSLTITAPDSLSIPVEQKRSWVPGDRVMPFNCTVQSIDP
jgi:hypothetical protein